MSHMLFAVASNNTFFFSNPGTTEFEALNFYNAEYANSMIYECWRLANRLVMITSNTVEFWDLTNNFEDPVSPAYSSNVYSLQALRNSIVRFNDALYFIARPVEMDTFSVYSLGKNGNIDTLSYPQLETWINKILFYDGALNYSRVIGSAICIENIPFMQWNLRDDVEKLTLNLTYNNFCFNDDLYFLCDNRYWLYNGRDIGALDSYRKADGESTPCRIVAANTNFDGKKRNVTALVADVDIEEDKRDPRENVLEPADEKRERFMIFNFDRVSKMPWTSMRKVILKPSQGSRNIVFKVFGIGLGTDFQAEVRWNGHLRINRLKLEVE